MRAAWQLIPVAEMKRAVFMLRTAGLQEAGYVMFYDGLRICCTAAENAERTVRLNYRG